MLRQFIAGALMVGLAACAPKAAPPAAPVSQEVAAPKPAGTAREITAADAGKTVEVGVGQTFTVALVGVPTAGYLWKPVAPPAFLAAGGELGGDTTKAQSQPGFTGGNHWEVFVFTATAAGNGKLRFEQRRPWETSEPPAATFEVTIAAK